MTTYLIEQRIEQRRQRQMMRRHDPMFRPLRLPGESSSRALVVALFGVALIIVVARWLS